MQQVSLNPRIFTISQFYRILTDALGIAGTLYQAKKISPPPVSKAFRERIMLAVTQVNGCSLCSYAHTSIAVSSGIEPEEIASLLGGDFTSAPPKELKALLFAQHFAETNGHISPEALDQLYRYYSGNSAKVILAYIKIIVLGNVLGIQLDAIRRRLKGKALKGSYWYRELGILTGVIWLLPIGVLHAALKSIFQK